MLIRLRKAVQRLTLPPAIKYLGGEFGSRKFRLLDVGAGNHAASYITGKLPNCEYYGIDSARNYGNDEQDLARMTGFWQLDLTQLAFDAIPDDFFDALNFTHVIEHLQNGDLVLQRLLPKLRKGGVVYIEYPRFSSTRLPSMRETLNFFDDQTHCRIYSLPELYNILLRNNCRPIHGGVRRNWFTIALMPVKLPRTWMQRGYLVGSDFWDLLGFAELVFARKLG